MDTSIFHIIKHYLSDLDTIRWLSVCKHANTYVSDLIYRDKHRMHKIPITSLAKYRQLHIEKYSDCLWLSHLRCKKLHINLPFHESQVVKLPKSYDHQRLQYTLPASIDTLFINSSTNPHHFKFKFTSLCHLKHVHLHLPLSSFSLRTFHHFKLNMKMHLNKYIITLPHQLLSLHLDEVHDLPSCIPLHIQKLSFRKILNFISLRNFQNLKTIHIQYHQTDLSWPLHLEKLYIGQMNCGLFIDHLTYLNIDCLRVKLPKLPDQLHTLIIRKCTLAKLKILWPLHIKHVQIDCFSQRIVHAFSSTVKRLILNQYRCKYLELPAQIQYLHVPHCALTPSQIKTFASQLSYAHTRNYVK